MNRELSEYLLTALQDIDYVDRMSGVVQIYNVESKNLPAGRIVTGKRCGIKGKREAIIPESQYKGIVFFEDRGIVPTKNLSRCFGFRSDLRLICWLNNNKIRIDDVERDPATYAIVDFTQRLSARLQPSEVFINTKATITGMAVQDQSVFGKYDFNEKTSGYLKEDFYYFALDLSVTFYVPKTCQLSITINPGTC